MNYFEKCLEKEIDNLIKYEKHHSYPTIIRGRIRHTPELKHG